MYIGGGGNRVSEIIQYFEIELNVIWIWAWWSFGDWGKVGLEDEIKGTI